jgi:hypothetical protein
VIWAGLGAAALFFVLLARLFRPTLEAAQHPRLVMEAPPLPKDLAVFLPRVERWRDTGRLSREEYEHLLALVREDAFPNKEKTTFLAGS